MACRSHERELATSDEGATTTVRSACWMTSCETLPSSSDLTPVRPRDPIAIARAPTRSDAARFARAVCRRLHTGQRLRAQASLEGQLHSLLNALLGAPTAGDLLRVGHHRHQTEPDATRAMISINGSQTVSTVDGSCPNSSAACSTGARESVGPCSRSRYLAARLARRTRPP